MPQLIFGLLLLGILFLVIKTKIPKAKKSEVDEVKNELQSTQEQSEVLDVKEQIVDEQLEQKKRKTKLNKKEEKLND